MEISYSSSGSGGLLLWKEKVVGGVRKGLLCKWKRRYLCFECLELMIYWKLRRKMMVQHHDERIDAEYRIKNDSFPSPMFSFNINFRNKVLFLRMKSRIDDEECLMKARRSSAAWIGFFLAKLAWIISHCLHNFLFRIHSSCWCSKSWILCWTF